MDAQSILDDCIYRAELAQDDLRTIIDHFNKLKKNKDITEKDLLIAHELKNGIMGFMKQNHNIICRR